MKSVDATNWAIAVLMARYNASIVEGIFSKWPTKWPENEGKTPPIHEIVFCATNLAFACELYLKACLMVFAGRRPPASHMLGNMFKDIPKVHRQKIQSLYDALFTKKFDQLVNGEIWIRFSRDDLPKDKMPSSLEEVLEHYSVSYTDWRYLLALKDERSEPKVHGLHYSRLMCLCETVDLYLQDQFPGIVRSDGITVD